MIECFTPPWNDNCTTVDPHVAAIDNFFTPKETGAIPSPRTIMDHAALTAAIGNSAFAIGVPSRVVERLASVAGLKQCSAGTTIFREGDYNHGFYLIHSGHVVLEMCTAARGCRQLLTLGPGEILAWSTVVGNSRMTTTAIAQDAVQLIEMSGPDLAEACETDHEVGYQLMKRLAAALSLRLLATRMQLLDLFVADAVESGIPA